MRNSSNSQYREEVKNAPPSIECEMKDIFDKTLKPAVLKQIKQTVQTRSTVRARALAQIRKSLRGREIIEFEPYPVWVDWIGRLTSFGSTSSTTTSSGRTRG